jgi:hypothetical protein
MNLGSSQCENFQVAHARVGAIVISVADPDPFDTDPDPAFHLDTDPDPAFQSDPDPTV